LKFYKRGKKKSKDSRPKLKKKNNKFILKDKTEKNKIKTYKKTKDKYYKSKE
jgi:hypothetical protein